MFFIYFVKGRTKKQFRAAKMAHLIFVTIIKDYSSHNRKTLHENVFPLVFSFYIDVVNNFLQKLCKKLPSQSKEQKAYTVHTDTVYSIQKFHAIILATEIFFGEWNA